MTTIALRKYLVSKINLLEDDLILEKIKKIIEKKEKVYELSEEQLKSIEISEKQILMGEYFNQEQMDEKFEQWSKRK